MGARNKRHGKDTGKGVEIMAESSISSSSSQVELSVAYQIEAAVVDALKYSVSAVSASQIRQVLDLSGEYKDGAGVVVSVSDLGAYNGNSVLKQTQTVVTCYTHLDADLNGDLLRSLASQAFSVLTNMTYTLQGWQVALPAGYGNYSISAQGTDGSYRQLTLTATQHLFKS